ncbi:PREDICTED: methylesterase 10 [Camelina sativa]|uniref:Methylesterase 10 n=1 Tax=Camelina sativa TaxID=90675 RepID=A0ABM0THQ5_CAMSA|nr:PREDICTED: methylesterase 10 [Camelina sativa]
MQTQHMQQQQLHHFVFVHGSCHGAWCWFKLAAKLKGDGQRVTAIELGGSGIDTRRLDEVRLVSEHLEPLMSFMESLPANEKVVLVGHSYGGIGTSLAMERFPTKVSVGIFLSAYMPHHDSPPAVLIQEYFKRLPEGFAMDSEFTFEEGPEHPPSSVMFGTIFMKEKAYSNCQLEDLELAMALVKPSWLYAKELGGEDLISKERYGSGKRVFIVCEGDNVLPEEIQKWMISNYEPNEVRRIEEAGHMAMLTKPQQLSQLLQEIAAKYN